MLQNAALALGKIGPDSRSAVTVLMHSLTDPDWPMRRHAAIALGEIGCRPERRGVLAQARIRIAFGFATLLAMR